jgi:cell wall-associated NlpC family hydrolase
MHRALLLSIACLAGTACASTGAVPRPFPTPGAGTAAGAGGGPAEGYSISATALSLRGVPYRNGGSDPTGFDCSGFVQYVFGQHGVAMPREVRQQFRVGARVRTAALAPGDLVFFTTGAPGASHVGIVIGADQFVHAPSTTGVVRVERLSTPYWATRLVGAKRVNQR